MQMVVHNDVRNQPGAARCDTVDDQLMDFPLQRGNEQRVMALGSRDDVKGRAWLVWTMHSCHNGPNFAVWLGRAHSAR